MKTLFTILIAITSFHSFALDMISEVVYVESPTDTDKDGIKDLIYVSINRPVSDKKLSTIFRISPYALGGTEVPMHNVDVDLLPQDGFKSLFKRNFKTQHSNLSFSLPNAPRYAEIKAHSLGTGHSKGCPTVGDMSETLAAKAVIDWLNGSARAFKENGSEVKADWANGNVGMTGTSYDGTLPIMVATTGVKGLKAIIPVAAISNWYNYYRANGLVVNPGGYIGEDADILGYYIVRKGACKSDIEAITRTQGRENGDFTPFWQKRDYLPNAKNIKAATFIIHGQSDWNVKQKHAIDLWEAMNSSTPKRIFLHRGGHSSTSSHDVPKKVQAWFDHFLEGDNNGITSGPQVEVELPDGSLVKQNEWPHERAQNEKLFFIAGESLSRNFQSPESIKITDSGSSEKLETLINKPTAKNDGRLLFLTAPLESNKLLTGTSKVTLSMSVLNRRAANITVAIVEYDSRGQGKIITRGWADPQNYKSIKRGTKLVPGEFIELRFDLEPKQYKVQAGNKIGVIIASTDYEYTLRPKAGTVIEFLLGEKSFIEMELSDI